MNRWGRLAVIFSFALFLLLCWAPVAALLAAALSLPFSGLAVTWLPSVRRLILLLETLGYSAAVATLTTLIGTAAALYCWRRNRTLARAARMAALLTAAIPPYLHALAWLPVSAALPGHGAGELTGWLSAIWVQSLAMLPFCFGIVLFALDDLDPRGIEAARICSSDLRLLARILLPLLRPAIMAASSLALLLTLSDHSVPSLFSRSTYAMELFEEFSASHNAGQNLISALPLLILGLLPLVPLARFWQKAAQRPSRISAPLPPLQTGGIVAALLPVSAVFVLLPALALVAALAQHFDQPSLWLQAIAAGAPDLATSAGVAAIAAIIACLPAVALSRALISHPRTLWWLVCIPLAMPSALIGAALIWIWNRDLLLPIYGTFWMLVLAALARFAPLAVLTLAAWRSRMDPALLEASRVYAPPARAFLRVELPLLAPALLAGAMAVFVLSLAELGASLLVTPPGRGTIALRIYNYLHYGASAAVSALAFCLMAASAAILLAAALLWKRRA